MVRKKGPPRLNLICSLTLPFISWLLQYLEGLQAVADVRIPLNLYLAAARCLAASELGLVAWQPHVGCAQREHNAGRQDFYLKSWGGSIFSRFLKFWLLSSLICTGIAWRLYSCDVDTDICNTLISHTEFSSLKRVLRTRSEKEAMANTVVSPRKRLTSI